MSTGSCTVKRYLVVSLLPEVSLYVCCRKSACTSAARSQPVRLLPEFISELYGVEVMTSKWHGMKLAQHLPTVNRKLYCQKESL